MKEVIPSGIVRDTIRMFQHEDAPPAVPPTDEVIRPGAVAQGILIFTPPLSTQPPPPPPPPSTQPPPPPPSTQPPPPPPPISPPPPPPSTPPLSTQPPPLPPSTQPPPPPPPISPPPPSTQPLPQPISPQQHTSELDPDMPIIYYGDHGDASSSGQNKSWWSDFIDKLKKMMFK